MFGFSDSWFTSWAGGTEFWHFFLNVLGIKWNRLVWPNVVCCSTEIILNSALTHMYINPDVPKGKLNLCIYQRAKFTPLLIRTRNFNYIAGTWRISSRNDCWIKASTLLALSLRQANWKECVNFTFCLLHLPVPRELPLRKPYSGICYLQLHCDFYFLFNHSNHRF